MDWYFIKKWRGRVANEPAERARNKKWRKLIPKPGQFITQLVIIVLIFLLGVSVGRGNITFGPEAIFHRTTNPGLPSHLNYSSVDRVYQSLRTSYDGQLNRDQLLDGLKEGLAQASGDPYTEYMNPKEAKDFSGELNGTFSGIGAELSKDSSGNIVIVSPIADTPAARAGLKARDIIAEINGKPANNLSISDATSQIRGPQGTHVKLKIIRGDQPLDFDIVRDNITIPSVETKTLDGNIGYMQVSRFGDDTSDLARKAATSFKQANVKGVILDLRGDPGGELNAAVDLSSLWLPDNKTVLTERRDGKIVQTYSSEGNATLAGISTVVLIDDGSASASEITAGALHDNHVATLIGEKSFGKGSVQEIVPFKDGSQLKVTIARWYTPAGKNIDKQGIQPDKTVNRSDDDVKNNRDPQLDAAQQFLNK